MVDLPLAALIGVLRPILWQDLGKLATRLFWPTAWFASLCATVGREAYRSGGAWAAAGAAALAATSIAATGQFRPGRIDHHNVQIVCAVAGLLFLVRSLDDRRPGWQAGGLLGLGLAVGYEAIALVVPALALAASITHLDPARPPQPGACGCGDRGHTDGGLSRSPHSAPDWSRPISILGPISSP